MTLLKQKRMSKDFKKLLSFSVEIQLLLRQLKLQFNLDEKDSQNLLHLTERFLVMGFSQEDIFQKV